MNDTTDADETTTGRPLDESGRPVDGRALSLDPSEPAASLFAESPHALVSDPPSGTWACLLERATAGETDRPVLLQWLAPDAAVPPEHVHPEPETFEAVEGTLTVVIEGATTRLAPGESATVAPDEAHTFRNDTDEQIAFRAELPSLRTVEGLYTAWGSTHESATVDGDEVQFDGPDSIRMLLASEELYPETEVTAVPLVLQRLVWGTAGRVARALGRDGVSERYLEDEFWREHVEQPTEL